MAVYIIMTLISMLFAGYAQNVREVENLKSTYQILGVMAFLPFAIVSAIRYQVGTDWPIYNDYFHSIPAGGKKFTEPLFNLLNRFLNHFTKNSYILFAVVAVLLLGFMFLAIFQQSEYLPLSILIFVVSGDFFNSQNQIRQMLATAILLYALKYVYNRNWKHYFLLLIIAAGIHISALLFIPVYFIYGKRVHIRKQIIAYLILGVSVPIVGKLVLRLISKTKYGWYIGSMYDTNNFYLIGFVFTLFFLAIFYYYVYCNPKQDVQYEFYVNLYYLAAVTVLFSSVVPQADRLMKLFASITCLAVPKLVFREEDRNRRILLYMLVVGAFTIKLVYDVYKNGWYDAIPYQTIFSTL